MTPAAAEAKQATGAVHCRAVSKVFGDSGSEVVAVDSVNLDVAPGEFVVILGPSGCGKSTLLSMIAGLEPVTSGEITADGAPVIGPGPDRCMIFQQSSLYPWMSVADNVSFGLKLRGVPKAERRETARDLLQTMGLGDFADAQPDGLSGGMRQRAAIARALAMQPRVLLMDEPFAALDVQTRAKLQNYIASLRAESGASVLFVTHSIDEAVALADRIVVFTARPGRIKAMVDVEMERPRDPRSPEYHALHDQLVDLLADEVDRAFAQQERARR
ncbi:ABC transporter ATP-binding protein [Mycolicibacterium duvalii]|uniref:Nitrate ABC transporter ATP-binding protein n=1 Tax=Mycolicibacterium duvalii TaxID=39688 RepID=A0A7I7JY55_9MYCO|nr:ABC transporter ATP-binding protein [Mycolicibacterium duvalii]MCV7366824.1 ABC transporter ATP-binding protein [Mycolicibacterium duvalii]PEG43951.1 ABC transporter ATP-binding protein [Mycolicibacterium duvalii]BBX16713.1 nitrate ABC transporter ATP-binding protein [Mycolicibacterium duvalii]